MKKTPMWYYTIIWLSLGFLSCLLDFLTLEDSDSFWGAVIVVPTLVWLYKSSK